jgi:hypothetical protein
MVRQGGQGMEVRRGRSRRSRRGEARSGEAGMAVTFRSVRRFGKAVKVRLGMVRRLGKAVKVRLRHGKASFGKAV